MQVKKWSSIALVCLLSACAGAPKTEAQQKDLATSVQKSVELVQVVDPTLKKFFETSYGYAVLPSVGKGGFIIAGAGGDGEVFKGGKLAGYCAMGQGTIGATVGGQSFDEFIFLQDETTYNGFVSGKFALAAQVSAVMVKSGGGAAAGYQSGVAVFVNNTKGAMLEASVGGQNFSFTPLEVKK